MAPLSARYTAASAQTAVTAAARAMPPRDGMT